MLVEVSRDRQGKKNPFYDFLESHAISSLAMGDKFTTAKWKKKKKWASAYDSNFRTFLNNCTSLKMMEMKPFYKKARGDRLVSVSLFPRIYFFVQPK